MLGWYSIGRMVWDFYLCWENLCFLSFQIYSTSPPHFCQRRYWGMRRVLGFVIHPCLVQPQEDSTLGFNVHGREPLATPGPSQLFVHIHLLLWWRSRHTWMQAFAPLALNPWAVPSTSLCVEWNSQDTRLGIWVVQETRAINLSTLGRFALSSYLLLALCSWSYVVSPPFLRWAEWKTVSLLCLGEIYFSYLLMNLGIGHVFLHLISIDLSNF